MTKEKHQIKAQERSVTGKKVKKIRKEGFVPSTIYGRGLESKSVQFKKIEVERLFEEAGESGLVELLLNEEKLPILFKNPQYHPVEGNLLHIDCYKVNLKEKITATVPIEFIGDSQAVIDGNVLVEVSNEVEVSALPTDLPQSITVDISILKTLEDMITVGDIKLDDKIEMVTQLDQVIVKIEEPRAEEVAPVEEIVAPGDVPATEQKTEEEKAADEAEKKENEKEE